MQQAQQQIRSSTRRAATDPADVRRQTDQMLANLRRYARRRIGNRALADDAVSETVLAACELGRVTGADAPTDAWLYGVLRHKLVDQLRRHGREVAAGDLADDGSAQVVRDGRACSGLGEPPGPEAALAGRELLALVLDECRHLPRAQRRAFVLRHLHDRDGDAICAELGVTDNHLWVLLHRARAGLRRRLLERGWDPVGAT